MKTDLYKFFYTALALSMAVFIYVVNKGITLDVLFKKIGWESPEIWIKDNVHPFCSYLLYIFLLLLFAFLLGKTSKLLIPIDMNEETIKSIEPASDGMMITYFGLFFFALSVNHIQALCITFFFLLICILISNVYMFNPIFSLLSYRFYYITFESGKRCLLISKEKFEHNDDVKLDSLHKLNEFTYIE